MVINLLKILNTLRNYVENGECSYHVPAAWNCCGFKQFRTSNDRPGEILVNPYSFLSSQIESILSPMEKGGDISRDRSPLSSYIMYGMLPRMFTAWNHGKEGKLDPGTFLKTLCLIPYLKRMNVGMIYLLPIFRHSDRYRKGSLGSPYAIKNVYMLDEHLHDDLLGPYSEELLETEFKAFVEACHVSGIKVMVDFVFRTVARDNDLIREHPDWFYWIDAKRKDDFRIPAVEKEKDHTLMSDKCLPSLYNSEGIQGYLASFRPAPNVKHPREWAEAAARCKKEGGNILEYAEREFGITTVPGFSDVINDNQPPWTDVTYLRYYFDVHEKARKYISGHQAPYILQDGAKLNLYRGDEKNEALWEYIAGVIPFYQTHYGIDGARIDMGHALPPDLNREIVTRAKKLDSEFLLWSEEFNVRNSAQAKKDGFAFITSMTWFLYKDILKPGFNRKLLKTLRTSELPVTGAMETPDTPRSAGMYRNRRLLKLLVWLNCFLPNSVPFINNGQELMEVQPMNLGLDNTEEGRFMLPKEDPMYGRLAFFDNYALHWLGADRIWMTGLLSRATSLRQRFSSLMSDKANFIDPYRNPEETGRAEKAGLYGKLLSLFYYDRNSGKNIFLLANSNIRQSRTVLPEGLLPEELHSGISGFRILCRDASAGNAERPAVGDKGAGSAAKRGGEAAAETAASAEGGTVKCCYVEFDTELDCSRYELKEKLALLPGEVVIGQFIR